ncbi:hypothetical protein EUX98_g4447 [Antrodiella citrinella]|uniref:Methyltransferase small domain-containing protein n=1 Tax=Antrodiella citrinella TaxID=2447956 RepID=A0A4S4MU31_9APHY|nr:hypothetical protein EUX98_g4447 [Antrodiella citrinella]
MEFGPTSHIYAMIPTPDLTHLNREDYDKVYEPAADTFLLLDALESDAAELKALKPRICLEIGTEAEEAQDGKDIRGAWAGGKNGMQVTDFLLEHVNGLLSPKGRFYLVAVKENNIPELQSRMRQQYGLDSKIVLQRRAGGEHLHVIRFFRG